MLACLAHTVPHELLWQYIVHVRVHVDRRWLEMMAAFEFH